MIVFILREIIPIMHFLSAVLKIYFFKLFLRLSVKNDGFVVNIPNCNVFTTSTNVMT